jgi:hypothetical protein
MNSTPPQAHIDDSIWMINVFDVTSAQIDDSIWMINVFDATSSTQ